MTKAPRIPWRFFVVTSLRPVGDNTGRWRGRLKATMELFQYGGFQTVEFALTLVLAGRLLITRSFSASFLLSWTTLAAAGLTLLHLRSDLVPSLPFFVSIWRILTTLFGATLVGEFVEEWRESPGGQAVPHIFGLTLTLAGTGLAWLNNYSGASACLLLGGFIGLGYCVRQNRAAGVRLSSRMVPDDRK